MTCGPFLAVLLALGQGPPPPSSYLARPAYCLEDILCLPVEPAVPRPGDIFLATDQALWSRVGHALAGGPGLHHSGVFFAHPDGRTLLLEAGPKNRSSIEVLDHWAHMNDLVQDGSRVYVRRRRVPLTDEQSARLTAFALGQEGKPFAVGRMLRQVTPFRTRGPLRTYYLGSPQGDRDRYFCSELATESLVAAGLLDRDTARPSATYPADLFWGRSSNRYLDRHLSLEPGWLPPARWFPSPPMAGPCAPSAGPDPPPEASATGTGAS